MRRSDHDVTNSIQTTRPGAVAAEVIRIYRTLYNGAAATEPAGPTTA